MQRELTSPTALDARAGPRPSLASFDLNLLVAFEALWVARSVTAAGRRLGLSQPATSAALARLRAMLCDRLFVRGKSGLEPTERCAELAAPISRTLIELRNTLAGSSFDPATTTRQIRIGAVDAAIAVWMPRLLARTMREAPRGRVQVVAIDPTRATQALAGSGPYRRVGGVAAAVRGSSREGRRPRDAPASGWIQALRDDDADALAGGAGRRASVEVDPRHPRRADENVELAG